MTEILALMTIIWWTIIPLFWIPVHGLSKLFKRIGLLTYFLFMIIWSPLLYFLYENRNFLLHLKIPVPLALRIVGIALLFSGTLLHIWTGRLLGLWGLIGLPEVSNIIKSKLVTEGPFSIIRHPTYISHTMIFSGVFFIS
ncbi:MAG: methyltransferase, partial [Nitrospirota bacterium]